MAALKMKVRNLVWLGLLAAAILIPGVTAAAPAAKIRLYPDRVDIGTFFQGVDIALQGEIPQGADAVVEIQGAASPQAFLRKGRRGGLWMTVGEIHVDNAPKLYLVLSSTPQIPQLAGQAAPWGLDALKARVKLQGALQDQEKDRFFKEFLDLQKSEDLYAALPGTLKISNSAGGGSELRGRCSLPAKIPQGNYQVRLSVIKDGKVLEQKTEQLEVKMVGFPAMLWSMAYQHAYFYGILAVLIAIATGFIMGFLFKGKTAH